MGYHQIRYGVELLPYIGPAAPFGMILLPMVNTHAAHAVREGVGHHALLSADQYACPVTACKGNHVGRQNPASDDGQWASNNATYNATA